MEAKDEEKERADNENDEKRGKENGNNEEECEQGEALEIGFERKGMVEDALKRY